MFVKLLVYIFPVLGALPSSTAPTLSHGSVLTDQWDPDEPALRPSCVVLRGPESDHLALLRDALPGLERGRARVRGRGFFPWAAPLPRPALGSTAPRPNVGTWRPRGYYAREPRRVGPAVRARSRR